MERNASFKNVVKTSENYRYPPCRIDAILKIMKIIVKTIDKNNNNPPPPLIFSTETNQIKIIV